MWYAKMSIHLLNFDLCIALHDPSPFHIIEQTLNKPGDFPQGLSQSLPVCPFPETLASLVLPVLECPINEIVE